MVGGTMRVFISVLLIIGAFLPCIGYTNLYNESIGEFNYPIFAGAAGAGNTEMFYNPMLNPSLKFETNQYYVALGLNAVSHRETRSVYIFDSYDNNIGKKNIYDNSNLYGEPAYIIGYTPVAMFGLSAGYENLVSREYSYYHVVRDDNYVDKSSETLEKTGSINAYFLSLSYEFMNITLGGNFSILQGDGTESYSIIYVDPAEQDSTLSISEDYSGLRGGFSLSYNYLNLVNAHLIYQIPTYVTNKQDINVSTSADTSYTDEIYYIMPSTIGLGIKYTPVNERPVVFMVDAFYERWTELNGAQAIYNDVLKYHLGVTHLMSKNMSILYGIMYEPYKKNNNLAEIGFTAGVSYKLDQTLFTFSAQYRIADYEKFEQIYAERTLHINGEIGISF